MATFVTLITIVGNGVLDYYAIYNLTTALVYDTVLYLLHTYAKRIIKRIYTHIYRDNILTLENWLPHGSCSLNFTSKLSIFGCLSFFFTNLRLPCKICKILSNLDFFIHWMYDIESINVDHLLKLMSI